MPKPKNKKEENTISEPEQNNDIKIMDDQSSLAEFTKRPLPTEEEVKNFDKMVEEEIDKEANKDFNTNDVENEEEIEESLNEIYQDGDKGKANIGKLDIKRKHGFLFWFFTLIFIIGSIGAAGYAAYYYFFELPGSDATAVEFTIEGKNEVTAGEEFFYTIDYKNFSNVNLRNIRIAVTFPDNFIFLDSSPASTENNGLWAVDSLPARGDNKIKIKGKLIGPKDETGIILANLTYTPENFSSEFKKEASFTTAIKDIGINFNFDYLASSLVGEENEVLIKFTGKENNYINNFRLTFEPQENIAILDYGKLEEGKYWADFKVLRPGVWQVDNIENKEEILPIKFKFIDKVNDTQDITLNFEQVVYGGTTTKETATAGEAQNKQDPETSTSTLPESTTEVVQDKYYQFFKKTLQFEVMKSDLNLALIINGSREGQGVDFGQTLNYSIVYKNKGETGMKDVVIMAVLESDFIDWTTLEDKLNGKEKGNTISWSKNEIPEFEVLDVDEEGTIDFSVKVAGLDEIDKDKDYQVKSYAQFSVGNAEEKTEENSDTRSNTIINKINSDLKLVEQVRYFSQDNIPVGTGPHPPKVGETTSYKVYWEINNNLHELNDLVVTTKLPDYIVWNNKSQATVGTIQYNTETREIKWDIGRLPVTVYKANSEFSISVTPVEDDKNKIMVLLSGTNVKAMDSETEANLEQTTNAKTTKLEDDDIATGDGRVE